MVVRRRRKKNKLRGGRYHGGGGTKNRRGAGNRGGVGRAGSHKHKFSKYYLDFGTKRTLKAKKKMTVISLEIISNKLPKWIEKGTAKKDGSIIVLDGKVLGFEKVLGNGSVNEKIKIENAVLTQKAADKIRAKGGIVEAEDDFEAEDAEEEAEA
ncbi:MAG TPA: uL15 family ribosomal protein [archaeon]|nr:uL15 family ribosomal protein [archaeon]